MQTKKWILAVLSVMVGVQLMSDLARADEVCPTLESCRVLRAKIEARIAELSKNIAPDLTPVAKNPDGTVIHMDQFDADNYCRNQGQRLPTARELALYSQGLGAQGISETEKDGHYLVKGSTSAGNPDNFYFSANGYQHPTEDLENLWIWSSSIHPVRSDRAYILYSGTGVIGNYNRSYDHVHSAVRCIGSR